MSARPGMFQVLLNVYAASIGRGAAATDPAGTGSGAGSGTGSVSGSDGGGSSSHSGPAGAV